MKQVARLEKLNNTPFFDTQTLSQALNVEGNTLYQNINRWLDQGKLIQLKKGLYVTNFYVNALGGDKDNYLEYISNILRRPSYLSLEYVLQKYSILSEAVFNLTLITTKKTYAYTNNLGVFIYSNIRKDLYTGYEIKQVGGYQLSEATKAKALFDYLYLKLYRYSDLTEDLIESLRLNLDDFTNEEIKEFGMYCDKSRINKYINLPSLLFQ